MPLPVKNGHRVSTRQKEKRNKVLVIQHGKEHLKFLKEEQKIKILKQHKSKLCYGNLKLQQEYLQKNR